MDHSLRHHLPDFMDVSPAGLSDTTFQIPQVLGSTSQLLLEDDTSDFFAGMDTTLSTPVHPTTSKARRDNPLTLAELTPRSRRTKISLKHTPATRKTTIPSPLKPAVAHDLSMAMEDVLSPFKPQQELSFQIPQIGNELAGLLTADDEFLIEDPSVSPHGVTSPAHRSRDPLTLSQLAPGYLPEQSSDSITTDPSDGTRSQPVAFSALKAEFETLDDSSEDLSSKLVSDSVLNTSSPRAATPADVDHNKFLHDDPHDISADHDQPTRLPDDVPLEISQANPERPRSAHRLTGIRAVAGSRKSAGKQTVIAGGIAKRSKPKLSAPANALRSKAIGKRTSGMQRTVPAIVAHNVGQVEVKSSVTAGKLARPAVLTSHATRPNSRETTKTISGSASQPSFSKTQDELDIAGPSGAETIYHSTSTQDRNSIAKSNASPTQERQKEGSAPLEPPGPLPLPTTAITDGDQELDRPSSCRKDGIASAQISPRDEAKPASTSVTPPSEDTVRSSSAVNDAPPVPSDPSSQVEDERVAPREADERAPTVPTSPMRRSWKRAAPDGADEDASTSTQNKRGRTANATRSDVASRPASSLKASGSSLTTRSQARALRPSRVKNNAGDGAQGGGPTTTAATVTQLGASASRTAAVKPAPKKPDASSSGALSGAAVGAEPARAPASSSRTRQLTASSSSASSLNTSTSTGESSGRPGSVTSVASSSGRSGGHSTQQQQQQAAKTRQPVPISQTTGSVMNEHMSNTRAGSSLARLAASLPAQRATVPSEFRFHSEARIEARKRADFAASEGTGRRTRAAAALGIPDFKALHDAEQQRLAAKKPAVVPVLPGRVELSTEVRAHEREKFDEGRRAREMEAERAAEEKRRLQAIEEEKEMKEMRRRAVPKANEVPEWYAHAPKRSRDTNKEK
ncbi:hypothetical protein BDW22DRAFT_1424416 [Trametopsis cervina]|nr:hypothetical protein BDW22DRAFT_1424416 [Trametopsis cervina]